MVVGGAGTCVYYSVGRSGGVSIEDHFKSKKRTFVSEESEEMIYGVENKDSNITKVWMKIRNWCDKTKSKVFTNYEDKMYQSFSIWCLNNIDIQTQLASEGLADWSLQDQKMEELAKEFNDPDKNLDSRFIEGTGEVKGENKKKQVTKENLKTWCTTNKAHNFKHELDQTYSRVKKWCFERKEAPKTKEVI
ncbi:hypothetical protein MHF_1470 [Mycoplasma haemofelis Ohio2]|uniref:Uncharacterized protein n=1 Tax=Mycoplasma haemofelis (strain Ohio2) TaxID=859194 RepID=F6FGZ5_MYCHI|nr:hypothetical protein MHF_1470 [Mycoplasma haemofelis Ohio2]